VDTVIEALSLLDEPTRNKIRYLVAGSGEASDYLKNLARAKQVPLTFTGEVTDTEKWGLLDACDIFIMPAREIAGDFEGFGIVYLEANLCGKPVIAGRSGGIPDAVIDRETGLLVDPEKPSAVAAAIKELVDNPILREHLGTTGKTRAVTDFTWEKQTAKLYNNLKLL
jgi:phosphatidylinositol alpha-1,6-mannosyltransferase